MAAFNLQKFRSEILSGSGLARTNRFEILITPPPALSGRYGDVSELASLYVEQTGIPPINIFTKPLKIFGPSYQRPITSEYGGEGLTLVFHVDREMSIRRFFEDWMHVVIDPNRFTVGYQEDYATTIKLSQLDEQQRETYEIEILEAFPKNLNIMELNNASSNQTHRLNVNFTFRYWRRVGLEKRISPIDIPRSIRFPQVPTFDTRLPDSDDRQWNWQTGELSDSPGSSLPPSP
jgi:hypothetical protein